MKKKHKYKYLISYCFEYQFTNSDFEYLNNKSLSGTGCMILESSFKIETEEQVKITNNNLMNIIKLEEGQKLISVNLYSFNLLKG